MLREWIAAHRSLMVTVTSGSVIAALIAAVAVVSTGYTAQKIDLTDGAVWVTNSSRSAIARANTQVLQLDSVVPADGSDVDVLQSGTTVLLVDRTSNKVDIVDAATSRVRDSVALPPNRPAVFLAGQTAVILAQSTGQLWMVPLADLPTFDVQAPATLSLGAGAVGSMDAAGTMFVYSASSRSVYRLSPETSDSVLSTDPATVPASSTLSMSSVGGAWALLDPDTRQLYLDGRTVDLDGAVTGTAAIQQPAVSGDAVVVAGADGLVRAPLAGGAVDTLASGVSGIAARPLVAGGCTYSAWTGGTAWRRCVGDTATGATLSLSAMPTTAALSFRVNGAQVLLNDSKAGSSWDVQGTGQIIDNWAALIKKDTDHRREETSEDTPPEVDKAQLPPVAVDDDFGARPDRTTLLPVLLNDYDPNGDVLTISQVDGPDPAAGTVDVISNGQQLQVTLDTTASGSFTFTYTISDGRGGTDQARVTVTVRSPTQNSPPRQVRASKSIVAAGGRATTDVLGDWVDPDGDAFYLTDATAAAPDTSSFTPAGAVVFTDAGRDAALKTVALAVSDGTDTGTGTLTVTVKPAGKVPIIAEPFIQVAIAGQEVTVAPLDHVRGGTGAIRLGSVPARTGVTVTPSYEAGTFRFSSDQIATHYVEYTVTDGDQSATGLVRVDVIAQPDANATPITVPKTVFVKTLRTERIDVAGTDIDPAGGVLLVTGISALADDSGVSAEVLEQRVIRVRLNSPLRGPVHFSYRVTNGLADATGTVTVVEIPTPTLMQPPVAMDDSVTVRVGSAIDIPVLANDEHPDDEELTLSPTLPVPLPEDSGLLFASGRQLRYLAPAVPGNFVAVYQITGPDGQSARARVRIAVREADANSNNPPVPAPVTARVVAGETVTIPIPLGGIDPDGDSVQLLGQATNPDKGSVTKVGPDSITYTAGEYSASTDTFLYTVSDAIGARATGEVRVGITPKIGGARNPVAILDEVVVRPGVTVSVRVLDNDSDPDDSPLRVISASASRTGTTARVSGELVIVTPPTTPGEYGVVYTIENASGGTSSNFVRVTVDPKAPLARPIAQDTVLGLSDIQGKKTLDVNVLANVFFADGSATRLGLSVYPGFGGAAEVTSAKRIRVQITDSSQIIPFRVTHPDDARVASYAFVWVPGRADALPQLDRDAPALSVVSGDRLVIPLADHVIAAGGKSVRITDSSTVAATHSNGDTLVRDSSTLVYTSAPRYFGAASISFEVTDGRSAADAAGRKATLVLPITVLPRQDQPPVFQGAVLEFEPGQEKTLDLGKLTTYSVPGDLEQLVFTVLGTVPEGFTYRLSGQRLALRANEQAAIGSSTAMSIGVRDNTSAGQSGRIELEVVSSSRPLAQPGDDTVRVRRGASATVDVLANDEATNPFPDTPLRVVAIRGLDDAGLPDGLTVVPSADRSRLRVTVTDAAEAGDTALQYQIADATGQTARYVWGTVRIAVQDRPDPVTAVHVTDFGDRKLTVDWSNGSANNAAITGYTVTLTSASNGAVVSKTDCSGSGCSVATGGNGSDRAVRVSVVASNSIGASAAATAASTAWSDVVPAAPADLTSAPSDHGVRIIWKKPSDSGGGTAITRYIISVDGVPGEELQVPGSDPVGTVYSRTISNPSIANGSNIAFSVSGRNQALGSLATWNRASGVGHPAGAPIREGTPDASVALDSGGTASLAWPGAFSGNGRAVSDYYAAVFTADAPTCSVSGELPGTAAVPSESSTFKRLGTATSTTFTGLTADTTYSFAVYAFNGMGCTRSVIVEATPRSRPGTVSSITTSGPEQNGTARWDYRLTGLVAGGRSSADNFRYRLVGPDVEGSEHGPRSFGSFLESSNDSQYGAAVSVEVKACVDYPEVTLCSADWSTPLRLGTPVLSATPGSLHFAQSPPTDGGTAATGTWTFASMPVGAYTSISYGCGDAETRVTDGGAGSCDVTASGTGDNTFPPLTVTITVGNADYVRTYLWSDYD